MLDIDIIRNILLGVIVNTTLILKEQVRRHASEGGFGILLRLDQ